MNGTASASTEKPVLHRCLAPDKKPPYTVAELLHILRGEGAKTLVSKVSKALQIRPASE
jgi:hypothetical protein